LFGAGDNALTIPNGRILLLVSIDAADNLLIQLTSGILGKAFTHIFNHDLLGEESFLDPPAIPHGIIAGHAAGVVDQDLLEGTGAAGGVPKEPGNGGAIGVAPTDPALPVPFEVFVHDRIAVLAGVLLARGTLNFQPELLGLVVGRDAQIGHRAKRSRKPRRQGRRITMGHNKPSSNTTSG
jgi:hypothetical protein